MGKFGGSETGTETGWERTGTSGVGERGKVSPRPEASSSELSRSDYE